MRTILITGASGGLAQEMVKLLPEDRLILLGRNQEKLEKLYASHPQAECIGIDITDSSAVQDLVEELYQRYGQIDILVNNAGYGIFEAFDRISDQQVQEMFEVNTICPHAVFTLDGCAHEGSRQGAHCQYRQHGGSRCNCQIQPLFGDQVCGHWLLQCSAFGTHSLWCPCDDGQSRPHSDHFL